MLITHLNTVPYSKFILIQDSVQAKANDLLCCLIKNRVHHTDFTIHYFVFQRDFRRIATTYSNITYHDFTSDVLNWRATQPDFEIEIGKLRGNSIVIIDSLAHLLNLYGINNGYTILHRIKQLNNVLQVITILHTDLLEDKLSIIKNFQHLSTFHMELQPKLNEQSRNRVIYTYKKSNKKIINQIEQYWCENDQFIAEEIKKPEPNIAEDNVQKILPENLSTFKISLDDNDKKLRDQLVLPYLPKEGESEPKIHYTFDEMDDWDEEDPDDDLDL